MNGMGKEEDEDDRAVGVATAEVEPDEAEYLSKIDPLV